MYGTSLLAAGAASIYTVGHKNMAVNFLHQLWQILTDFDKFCTPITGNKFVTKCIYLLAYLV